MISRFEAAKEHPLPRPYVIKPVAEGSSVGVFIVTEAHEHPPQELYRDDWTFGDRVVVEHYIAGQGADLRGHGRPGAGRDRDRPDRRASTIMRRNTHPAGPSICCPRKFYQIFTKRPEDWRLRRIVPSAAEA